MQNMACFYINQILLQIINVSLWSFIVLFAKDKNQNNNRHIGHHAGLATISRLGQIPHQPPLALRGRTATRVTRCALPLDLATEFQFQMTFLFLF